jgi:alcohol dehydrogenase (NADP+)
MNVRGYAAKTKGAMLEPFSFTRREPGADDVAINIDYCGICHSDVHQVRDEWGSSIFPMVPGHEIVGHVSSVGKNVTKFKAGETVGVGCFVDSCRVCAACKAGEEQFCERGMIATYNSREKDGKTPTYGGYSTAIVVDQNYVLKVPKNLELANVAPLLCAGITTYSPMRRFGVAKGQRIGVVGLGGLGHMAVKLPAAFGTEVTVFSTSRKKEADAKRMGAAHFVVTKEPDALKGLGDSFDFIIDTVSAPHDLNSLVGLLRRGGTMTLVGVPPETTQIHAMPLILRRRQLVGSLIGGIKETQEMLDFCGDKKIGADIELIAAKDANNAYERMVHGDVKYRFVIDSKTLG